MASKIATELNNLNAIVRAIKGRAIRVDRIDDKTEDSSKTPIERLLVGIWADVLRLDEASVSIQDNFFDVGGHSLTGTVMLSRIQKEFGIELSLQSLFERPTIAELSAHLESELISQSSPAVLQEAIGEVASLSERQKTDLLESAHCP